MLLQYRLLTRAAPIQSHDRKGVVSATNAQHHAVEDLVAGSGARMAMRLLLAKTFPLGIACSSSWSRL